MLNRLKVEPDVVQNFTRTYNFTFLQDLGNGVLGPDYCAIHVDTVKGQVVFYSGISGFPVLISPVPDLSPEQAMQIAMQSILLQPGNPGEVEQLGIIKPDMMGGQRLIYVLYFNGIGLASPDQATGYVAMVDAHDGTVFDWDTLQGMALLTTEYEVACRLRYDQSEANEAENRTAA